MRVEGPSVACDSFACLPDLPTVTPRPRSVLLGSSCQLERPSNDDMRAPKRYRTDPGYTPPTSSYPSVLPFFPWIKDSNNTAEPTVVCLSYLGQDYDQKS